MRVLGQIAAVALIAGLFAGHAGAQGHTSTPFAGVKVNGGTVTHSTKDGKHVLTLSNDFKVPDTPDPHWQIVDGQGRVYLLQRLDIKDKKINTSITLPAYVEDVAKVQIYCAWAEALLGEASFQTRIMTQAGR
jgi:parvulin-like peptidyl-prolyl isomerase